jgi:hypothetical protein
MTRMSESELIFLLAKALQESQWYMLMEDDYPPIFICPSCEQSQSKGKHLDHRGAHRKSCAVDQALTAFDEWVRFRMTKYEKRDKGIVEKEWKPVDRACVCRALKLNYRETKLGLAALENGEIVETLFTEYRIRPEKEIE